MYANLCAFCQRNNILAWEISSQIELAAVPIRLVDDDVVGEGGVPGQDAVREDERANGAVLRDVPDHQLRSEGDLHWNQMCLANVHPVTLLGTALVLANVPAKMAR